MLFIVLFRDKKMLRFSLILIVFLAVFILFYPNSIGVFNAEYANNPILIRLNLWQEAMGIIKDYPFFGVGLRNYLTVVHKYEIHNLNISISQLGETTGLSPHNGYLQMAAETGLIGLGCFLWMLWTLFRNGIKSRKIKLDPVLLGLLSGLLAFLVSAFFDNHLNKVELSAMFWIMLGLAAGWSQKQKDTSF
jgi:putative inorganic carbon (HCO3(-)) transporter